MQKLLLTTVAFLTILSSDKSGATPLLKRRASSSSSYVKLMQKFRRHPNREAMKVPLATVLNTFAYRNVRGKPKAVHRTEENMDFGKAIIYKTGRYSVVFRVTEKDEKAIDRVSPKAMNNLARSVSHKLGVARRYYKDLLKASKIDIKTFDDVVPDTITIDTRQGGFQYFANAHLGEINLGYKVLLNDYGIISKHEMFHVISKNLLKTPHDRRFDFEAIEEGLADYFAAVIQNQPRMGNPAARWTNKVLSEAKDGKRLAKQDPHAYGQIMSGMLWRLRKAFNHQDNMKNTGVSYADRLALVAYGSFINAVRPKGTVKVRHFVDALHAADKQLSKGRNKALIDRICRDHL